MPPRRRTSPPRAPKVAGRAHRDDPPVAGRPNPGPARRPSPAPAAGPPSPAGPGSRGADREADAAALPVPRGRRPVGGVAREPVAPAGAGRARPDPQDGWKDQRGTRAPVALLVALVAVTVIAVVLAGWFRNEADQLWESPAAQNQALVDGPTTAQVKSQISEALETVYSYDFARLDENERAAREVITGDFTADYEMFFRSVRDLAPEQQAVVTGVVTAAGVKVLDGDRAIVVAFLDQQATRGVDAEQVAAPARLTVTAERTDGQWKIAAVEAS